MRQTIHRKDGITYERLIKEKNYDCNLSVHYFKKKIAILKQIAELEGDNYSEMIRELIDKFIDKKVKEHNLTIS